MGHGRAWFTVVAVALSGCAGHAARTAGTPASSTAVATSAPPSTTTTTVAESVAEELDGVISIAVQLQLTRPEIQCVANGLPLADVQAVASQGFYSITVKARGELLQAVARCASVQTQAQFGTKLVQSRGLDAKEAACVTKAFFEVLRTNLQAAEQANVPLPQAAPQVRDAVTNAIHPCLSKDKLAAFLQQSAAPA